MKHHVASSTFSLLSLFAGASGRSGGAGHCRVQSSEGVSARGGGAHKGETAEAERGETQPAGGGAYSDHRANQPAGKYSRPASPQADGGGKPGAAQGEREQGEDD